MSLSKENYFLSDLTEKIIKEAYFVYNKLGWGFLEKVYENALKLRLEKIGLSVKSQFPIKVIFDNVVIGEYYADLFVEDSIIVEIKAVKAISHIHEVQLVNYLKATGTEIGLLINFGEKIDIKRKIFTPELKNKT